MHLVGVGGAGMRGLALVLARAGYRVSGCDRAAPAAAELEAEGVRLAAGHDPSHVGGADLVVATAAVPAEAPELRAAREAGIPVLKRAAALGALLLGRRVVAIAGTHGKTTVTAMTGLACEAAGLDPTVLVGGRVPAWDGFARPGEGELAVVEADEFDRSFLELWPSLAVLTSVEPEHLESYEDEAAMRRAFQEFADRAAADEGVIWCADDRGAAAVGEPLGGRSYGLTDRADYRIRPLSDEGGAQRCRFGWDGQELEVALRVPGAHNAQNAAAALAVVGELGADPAAAALRLADFTGVERRLEVLTDRGGIAVVDDYAHHPTEVRASLAALRRRFPGRRLVAVFQPHLFSRTRAFATEFAEALLGIDRGPGADAGGGRAGADEVLLLPIYPAREEPIPGVTSALIAERAEGVLGASGRPGGAGESPPADPRRRPWLASEESALERVREAVAPGAAGSAAKRGAPAVFAFMGAGDVTELAREAARLLGGGGPGRALGG